MFARKAASFVSRSLAAAAATAILLSATAQAGEVTSVDMPGGRTVRSVTVPFVDLDLTTKEGAATLATRLKAASRAVCGETQRGPLREQIDHRACVEETMASGQRAMVTLIARAEAGDRFKPGERIAFGS
jgi:UrcA family protein